MMEPVISHRMSELLIAATLDPFGAETGCALFMAIADLERRAELAEALHRAQPYIYIGRDSKPVLARDLEDRAERAEALVAAAYRDAALLFADDTRVTEPLTGHEVAARILTRIPADAQAALDRITSEAVNAALERAARGDIEREIWGQWHGQSVTPNNSAASQSQHTLTTVTAMRKLSAGAEPPPSAP